MSTGYLHDVVTCRSRSYWPITGSVFIVIALLAMRACFRLSSVIDLVMLYSFLLQPLSVEKERNKAGWKSWEVTKTVAQDRKSW